MYKNISSLQSVISQIYHHGQCWQEMCPQVESSSPTRCEPRATSPCSTLCRSLASFREALKSWFPNLLSYAMTAALDMKEKPTAAIVDQGMPDTTISQVYRYISVRTLNSGPIRIPNGRSSLPARSLWRGLLVRWHPRRTWSVIFRLFEFYAQYIDKAMMMFSKKTSWTTRLFSQ